MENFLKITLISLSLLGLIGCATVKTITGPDGTENLLITCGDIEQCYKKATESCNGPYKIVNTSSETTGSNGTTDTYTNLLVKCGK